MKKFILLLSALALLALCAQGLAELEEDEETENTLLASEEKAKKGNKALAKTLQKSCYIGSYGRGAGSPLTSCNANESRSGALCYPKCKAGYKGRAFVCWKKCPSGFRNIGVFCQKPKAYGRGAGYLKKSKCLKKHPSGCQRTGLIYYPKCKPGYHHVGCCICSPNCPSGMKDTGTGCRKKTYTRGAGHILRCKNGKVRSGLLCYPKCKPGYKGIGPVCWGKCPAGMTKCGVFCLNGQKCSMKILKIVSGVVDLALDVVSFIPGAEGLKAVSTASKAAKTAGKMAKVAREIAKQLAKQAVKTELKKGKSALKKTAIGVAKDTTPKAIANAVLETLVPGYTLAEEFVMKKCKY